MNADKKIELRNQIIVSLLHGFVSREFLESFDSGRKSDSLEAIIIIANKIVDRIETLDYELGIKKHIRKHKEDAKK